MISSCINKKLSFHWQQIINIIMDKTAGGKNQKFNGKNTKDKDQAFEIMAYIQ